MYNRDNFLSVNYQTYIFTECKGFVCENGGTLLIEAGQCVCSCPSPYVGFNCQFRGTFVYLRFSSFVFEYVNRTVLVIHQQS